MNKKGARAILELPLYFFCLLMSIYMFHTCVYIKEKKKSKIIQNVS